MISVIMPAYNEEALIRETLSSLLDGADVGELEVIVVCNGCSDKTFEIAKNFGEPVRVLETQIPSKTNALNIGDSHATGFPRFYLDADLTIRIQDIRIVANALRTPGIYAAAPKFVFDVEHASPAVKAYYSIWKQMPYFDSGRIAGAYGLSEEGRKRFDFFPDIIADDGFVRLHFAPHERITVEESKVIVKVPSTIKDLLQIKTRSYAGTRQLRKCYPRLFANETANPKASFRRILFAKYPIKNVLTYFCVSLIAKIRGRFRRTTGTSVWERDNSSRQSKGAT